MYSLQVMCSVSGVGSGMGTIYRPFRSSPEFHVLPHFLVVAGGWVTLEVDLESLVVPGGTNE